MVKNTPKLCVRRDRNVSFVTLDKKRIYLGRTGTPETLQKYHEVVNKWLKEKEQNGVSLDAAVLDGNVSVRVLCEKFLNYASDYYRKNGESTRVAERFAVACNFVISLYGNTPASSFSPLRLRAVQDAMLQSGRFCRSYLNQLVNCVRAVFKWGVARGVVEPNILVGLQVVEGLKRGRTSARESDLVRPIDDVSVQKTAKAASEVVADLIFFIRRTGCRPGEAFQLRMRDVVFSEPVWIFFPEHYKTEHHARARRRFIPIAGECKSILARRSKNKTPDDIIFSPRDALIERYRNASGELSQAALQRVERTAEQYDRNSFRRAIERAARRAGVSPWAPNRLRHAAATEIREKLGIEAAQAILGHASAKTTEIYAEIASKTAMQAADAIWGNCQSSDCSEREK